MKNAHEFSEWRSNRLRELRENLEYKEESLRWLNVAVRNDYSYLFQWMGVPIIQFPSDVFLIQEAVFRSKANKVIEVGIARGGMTLFLASLLKLIHESKESAVIGVDIKISQHTRDAVVASKMKERIVLVEGDSSSTSTLREVQKFIKPEDKVLVILDSNHTYEHVYKEISLYAGVVSTNSYLIVMDTAIEYLDPEVIGTNKLWGRKNSPQTAIERYLLDESSEFEIDLDLDSRSLPGASRGGFLRKI